MIDGITTASTAPSEPRAFEGPGGKMGKDEFLQLLVSQLRNQDPLNPSDPKDFAAQLAQFSTVEQLLNINEQLEGQAEAQAGVISSINSVAALQLIGKSVLVEGNTVSIPDTGDASVRVDVEGTGGSGELILKDDAGIEVGRIPLARLDGGTQTIDLSSFVGQLEAGEYTYDVQLQDSNGQPVGVTTYARMRIDGMRYTPSGPVLMSGTTALTLGSVVEIGD